MKKIIFLFLVFFSIGCTTTNINISDLQQSGKMSEKNGQIYYNNTLVAYYSNVVFDCYKKECVYKIYATEMKNYQVDTFEYIMSYLYKKHPNSNVILKLPY